MPGPWERTVSEMFFSRVVSSFLKSSSSRLGILIGGLLLIFSLDFLLFRQALWAIPNESAWSTNHFYNFLYEYFRIRSKSKTKFRILLVGSSIAHYSLDRGMLNEEILRLTGKEVESEFLSYAGMTPLDAYLLRKKIIELNPDLIVYPINFIDWRLHRTYVLDPVSGRNDSFPEDRLILDALDYGEAPQSRYIFPAESAFTFWKILGPEKTAEFIMAAIFDFYRYKDIYWKNIRSLFDHRFGRNTSYHGYNGAQIPERISSLGWTGRSFSFAPKEYMTKKGFYIQVVREILREGNLHVSLNNARGDSQNFDFDTPGWKRILLDKKFLEKDRSFITAKLSRTWIPYYAEPENKDWVYDRLGVRLQQTFGDELPRSGMQYTREERSEDLRYVGMSDSEYREYFYFRLLAEPEHRPGIGYLIALAEAKKKVAGESFRPAMHFRYMSEFLDSMRASKVPVLLINNPENPISLNWYENSRWYQNHLEYLRSISGRGVTFSDFKDRLDPIDFSDYHHFTYPAMKKMNPVYAREIIKFVE